ncbi:hypothetical protein MES5069_1280002 [Mesorhizobium escarrei]|uniref:Uncharacterized protein n=1 Tax=Mesorhizobium escarrei TaxID=666018 RepID=A0ABM9DHD8_9HYPH|nr:hypothetical protein MES5069_1280002 [Mesorhizobium escarrei]
MPFRFASGKTARDFEWFIPAIPEMPYRSRLFNRQGALRREKERLAILRCPAIIGPSGAARQCRRQNSAPALLVIRPGAASLVAT